MIFDSKRSESDIIYIVLNETVHGIKKTQLMYNANMSNTQLNRYLDILIDKKFIEERETQQQGKKYYLTDKGGELLDPLNQVISLFKE